MPTSDFDDFAQSGVAAGYGATWALIAARRRARSSSRIPIPVTPRSSPSVNLARGAAVLQVDGVDAVNDGTPAGVDALNAGLFPAPPARATRSSCRIRALHRTRSVTMTSVDVTSTPVQNVAPSTTASGNVGYMLFNDHIATAEQELIDAVEPTEAAGIADLVLDIRYNGGGFLDIASEAAYMIAGNARTSGKTFELTVFNSKHPTTDPVTGQPLAPLPFQSTASGFSAPAGQPLPTLNLPRVFVLTGSDTCSASESIINSLHGVDVEVIQIGSTTCGKPYGFYPQDNCGTTYFTRRVQGREREGFRRLHRRFFAGEHGDQSGRGHHRMFGRRRLRARARRSARAALCRRARVSSRRRHARRRPESRRRAPLRCRRESPSTASFTSLLWLQNRIMRR